MRRVVILAAAGVLASGIAVGVTVARAAATKPLSLPVPAAGKYSVRAIAFTARSKPHLHFAGAGKDVVSVARYQAVPGHKGSYVGLLLVVHRSLGKQARTLQARESGAITVDFGAGSVLTIDPGGLADACKGLKRNGPSDDGRSGFAGGLVASASQDFQQLENLLSWLCPPAPVTAGKVAALLFHYAETGEIPANPAGGGSGGGGTGGGGSGGGGGGTPPPAVDPFDNCVELVGYMIDEVGGDYSDFLEEVWLDCSDLLPDLRLVEGGGITATLQLDGPTGSQTSKVAFQPVASPPPVVPDQRGVLGASDHHYYAACAPYRATSFGDYRITATVNRGTKTKTAVKTFTVNSKNDKVTPGATCPGTVLP